MPKYLNSPETPDLFEGPDAVRAEPDEALAPSEGVRDSGRGVFRFRAGVPGMPVAGRGRVRNGADVAAGAVAAPVRHQGGAELRPRRGGPGRGGQVGRPADYRRIPGAGGAAAARRRPGRVHPEARCRRIQGRHAAVEAVSGVPAGADAWPATTCARTRTAGPSCKRCWRVAAKIPDAAARDQFADTIAHRAKITESVVRAEIRKAAVERRTEVSPRQVPTFGQVKPAERGLIWALINRPDEAAEALFDVEPVGPGRPGDRANPRAGPVRARGRGASLHRLPCWRV